MDLKDLAAMLRRRDPRMTFMLTFEEREEVATALDAYARILAASPDVRQIERLHGAALTRLGIEQSNQAGKDADSDRATLLDVVRRQDAEIERLRKANETFVGEAWKTERELIHAANQKRDAERARAEKAERERDEAFGMRATFQQIWDALEAPGGLDHALSKIECWKMDETRLADLERWRERAGPVVELVRDQRAAYLSWSAAIPSPHRDELWRDYERKNAKLRSADLDLPPKETP